MNKAVFLIILIFSTIFLVSCTRDQEEEYIPVSKARLYAGGETTVFLTSSNSFSTPAANLDGSDLEKHLNGDFQFEAAFVTAPAEVNGGVGPIFNNTSCVACHGRDGRSSFPTDVNGLSGFFLRVSVPGIDEFGGPKPVPGFGTQLQNQAIFGYEPEAKFDVTYTSVVETFADGTQVTLRKPDYKIVNPYMALPSNVMISPRLAPPVFGLGLLEAIPEAYIIQNEDVNDVDGDGISGKANYVHDIQTGKTMLGRFGWKANTTTILEQCTAAYNNDMGITSYFFPQETGHGQTNGDDGLGDDPEVSNTVIDEVVFYCKTLAVPAPRDIDKPEILKGEQIFNQIECAKCHIPKMQTGPSELAILANQTIFPYSDMLLHDMGEGLADNRPDFLADGREWKTRPLWGIGLTKVVNGHNDFLHDGRAKNITEAILWHDGEGHAAKEKFKRLSAEERENLLKFIKSL